MTAEAKAKAEAAKAKAEAERKAKAEAELKANACEQCGRLPNLQEPGSSSTTLLIIF